MSDSSSDQSYFEGRNKEILMILSPVIFLLLILGIYKTLYKENYTSCTCSKNPEKYTYMVNQPKTLASGKKLELQPSNSFVPTQENYCTPCNNLRRDKPESNGRFSGV